MASQHTLGVSHSSAQVLVRNEYVLEPRDVISFLTTNCLRRTIAMSVPMAIPSRLYNTVRMTWTQHIA